MRHKAHPLLDANRLQGTYLGPTPPGALHGAFMYRGLYLISSGDVDGPEGWEHVSVSHPDRCPTWEEMAEIKSLFWRDDETVLQFHPRRSEYVNTHNYCLHLWKHAGVDHELPPAWMVGIKPAAQGA